ncbi:hypothetical protein FLAVO9R_30369 [Flavobacterium sp. 9R]|nr:hypothetical protein FLAVO9R_30369 [Flavobacterium sp. 9R]
MVSFAIVGSFPFEIMVVSAHWFSNLLDIQKSVFHKKYKIRLQNTFNPLL